MPCDRIDPLVTPFIDGALPEPDRRSVEDHLRVCPPCHSRVAAERQVHELIRARVPLLNQTEAPDTLHAKCWELARLKPQAADAAGARATLPRRLAPYALAASLVLVVGGAFVYQATDKSARVLAAELTADHVKCFAMNGAFGTHARPRRSRARWPTFDWRMHLPANQDGGSRAGRFAQCVYGEGEIAHHMRHQGRGVALHAAEAARTEELVECSVTRPGLVRQRRTFVLVAREPRAEVERMASFASVPPRG
jgi:hypothetical protein